MSPITERLNQAISHDNVVANASPIKEWQTERGVMGVYHIEYNTGAIQPYLAILTTDGHLFYQWLPAIEETEEILADVATVTFFAGAQEIRA